ncbi:riboflavin synthase subunit alpha : Riboflavin synthase subunit alpha OS=Rhodopirellula europaea 6C GN=RE6C_04406 PE=4 SV=1: Lum_binding: Lum_binding [Gemmata massiliana]|uniref:Riboflavin synthase n=1 Tax=Gemmata massiliana TaxID=1210884 RepID=A0A6P2D3Q7_9BACT|nr:riboflavin synthase [Gemmata massiliana]VTR95723.1 riboflavin synthase subunit alpha : Riboflavin synthase subunit alpha OS=Rhodopirellula europaea 6C GN=RE6C_04406 PE=4 SV=1: Lum_binding: Lum_binding [Gemmata massiliana]
MFTGLVQALGEVRGVADVQGGRRLRVAEPALAPGLQLGESVSVCGACLTVVAHDGDTFDFEVGPETLVKTTLGRLAVGDRVNLERALRVGDSLGGHFVTGHVDCVGKVLEETVTGEWLTVWFGFPPEFEDLLVGKGSVAVDGVSLTLVDVQRDRFSIMLIPHTRAHTTLGFKKPGDAVNLEFDLLAKHVQKLFKRVSLTI